MQVLWVEIGEIGEKLVTLYAGSLCPGTCVEVCTTLMPQGVEATVAKT
jgi:hypothetical protein